MEAFTAGSFFSLMPDLLLRQLESAADVGEIHFFAKALRLGFGLRLRFG
jgi:hypothetical protein